MTNPTLIRRLLRSVVLSLSAGSVSFTHIIKSAEPIFSTLIQAVLGITSPLMVNLCLLPIVAGVR